MSPIYNKPTHRSLKGPKDPRGIGSKLTLRIQSLLNQAVDLHQRGALKEAQGLYDSVLAADPKNFEALHLSGLIAYQCQNTLKGVQLMREALKINSQSIACLVNLGLAEHAIGDLATAIQRYHRALSIKKDLPQAHYNLANIHKEQNNWNEAKLGYEIAITLKPDYWEALLNLANISESTREWTLALQCLNRVIKIIPNLSKAYNNRGNIFKKLERWRESIQDYDTSIQLDHTYPDVYVNKGNLLKELGYWDHASACYKHCLELNHFHPKGVWNQSLLSLMQGQFKQGWLGYEARWDRENAEALNLRLSGSLGINEQKKWRGNEIIKGQRLLLYAEQGFGDSIQFIRFVPNLINMGAVVILMVQKPLLELFNQIDGVYLILEMGQEVPEHDLSCPLMSLPLALKLHEEENFNKYPYLKADPFKVSRWEARLSHIKSLRVGIAWRGSTSHANDKFRSLHFEQFKKCIPIDAQCVSLQKEVSKEEGAIVELDKRVADYTVELNDFSDTAGLCANLDLIICVDTSVAHLASALGKPVWIMLAYSPDWRWMINRADSPWYDKVVLYRQDAFGEWDGVLNEIKSDWSEKIKAR